MFKSLRSRLIGAHFLVVLISLLLASGVFVLFLFRYARSEQKEELTQQVRAVARDIGRIYEFSDISTGEVKLQGAQAKKLISNVLNSESRVLHAKLILLDSSGALLMQAKVPPELPRATLEIPEKLLDPSGPNSLEWYSSLFGRRLLACSSPVISGNGRNEFLIAIKTSESPLGAVTSLVWFVMVAGLASLAISMGLGFYLSGAISRPVMAVSNAARRMAFGDYNQKVPVEGPVETSQLAEDFNTMASRVRRAYELQRDFIGNVSHELRTPLTSIEGFSQLLLENSELEEGKKRRFLSIIHEESKRVIRVLRDLLTLAEIDSGLRAKSEEVDMVDLLRKLESIYSARALDEGIKFEVSIHEEVIKITSDKDRLERVLVNLLDNAFKYTESGGSVRLAAIPDRGWVHISVEDTGRGIPEELLPKIFDRFYRAGGGTQKSKGGAGLGLSICKQILDSLGGRISVRSAVGHGTTFTVTVPYMNY